MNLKEFEVYWRREKEGRNYVNTIIMHKILKKIKLKNLENTFKPVHN